MPHEVRRCAEPLGAKTSPGPPGNSLAHCCETTDMPGREGRAIFCQPEVVFRNDETYLTLFTGGSPPKIPPAICLKTLWSRTSTGSPSTGEVPAEVTHCNTSPFAVRRSCQDARSGGASENSGFLRENTPSAADFVGLMQSGNMALWPIARGKLEFESFCARIERLRRLDSGRWLRRPLDWSCKAASV